MAVEAVQFLQTLIFNINYYNDDLIKQFLKWYTDANFGFLMCIASVARHSEFLFHINQKHNQSKHRRTCENVHLMKNYYYYFNCELYKENTQFQFVSGV